MSPGQFSVVVRSMNLLLVSLLLNYLFASSELDPKKQLRNAQKQICYTNFPHFEDIQLQFDYQVNNVFWFNFYGLCEPKALIRTFQVVLPASVNLGVCHNQAMLSKVAAEYEQVIDTFLDKAAANFGKEYSIEIFKNFWKNVESKYEEHNREFRSAFSSSSIKDADTRNLRKQALYLGHTIFGVSLEFTQTIENLHVDFDLLTREAYFGTAICLKKAEDIHYDSNGVIKRNKVKFKKSTFCNRFQLTQHYISETQKLKTFTLFHQWGRHIALQLRRVEYQIDNIKNPT